MYYKYLLKISNNNQAIIYTILSSLWISIMLCAVRYVSAEYNSFVMVFWRSCFSLLFMLPWFLQKKTTILKTSNIKLHFFRAVIGVISMTCWFYALGKLLLPQAISLSFTAPIFTAIAAVIFLKEKLGKRRAIAIIIGFIGALIIIRPGFSELNYALFIVLFSTSLWAIIAVIIKKLTYNDNHKTILFYMCLFSVFLSLPLAIIFWQDVNLYYLMWFAFIGFTANLSHICLTKAISLTNLTVILPFDFIRLVFTSIFAYIIFKDPTNIYDIIGAIIIISSNVYISYRENKVKNL